MAYNKHNYQDGEILHGSQLNEMDTQIAANEERIVSLKEEIAESIDDVNAKIGDIKRNETEISYDVIGLAVSGGIKGTVGGELSTTTSSSYIHLEIDCKSVKKFNINVRQSISTSYQHYIFMLNASNIITRTIAPVGDLGSFEYNVDVENGETKLVVLSYGKKTSPNCSIIGTSIQYISLQTQIDSMSVSSNCKWKDKNMVMFGDSIVYAVADDADKGGYVGRLKELLGLEQALNRGLSGRCLAIVSGISSSVVEYVNSYTGFTNQNLVIIAGGTNDFRSNVPLGTIDSDDNTTVYGALNSICNKVISTNPNARLWLWTPLQRDNSGYDVNYTNSEGLKLIDYVNAIKAIGQKYAVPVCDMYATSGITKLNLSVFTSDGLHLNGNGYDYVCAYASEQAKII